MKNNKVILISIIGYFAAYSIGFRRIIHEGFIDANIFLLILANIIATYLVSLVLKSKLKYSPGLRLSGFCLLILLLLLHISTSVLGPTLGPSTVEVSENPSVLPVDKPNSFLVNLNTYSLIVIYILSISIGFQKDRNNIKNPTRNYLYFTLLLLTILALNWVLLPIINISYMLLTWR